ncbi:ribbon-helix-helix domain-containing protein [Bosea sp. (in: a-proteobacteria)]|uniref:ribbon-helix-helix domain-containing protein n=1 Tax=Bosea sp. (in: a-proteobacteria) TaxID=1871050 RepID=UPI002B49B03C|nr:ribbon-helix-helix domain-containing protein [Bosea sp. (in: a-proteobacteria)]WRH59823.1 MAG: ribbon-helix-helix domain-containing protein [Bosea sp. (in: a-proteobacteria)]
MSAERKRSLTVAGHRTSVSLEEPFWEALKEIAAAQGLTVAALIAAIDGSREGVNLSSALRLHVLAHYQRLAASPEA